MPLFKGWVLNYGPITEGFPSVFHDVGVLLGLRDSDCSPILVPQWCGSKL